MLFFFVLAGCEKNNNNDTEITVISVSVNGSTLQNEANNIPVSSTISIVFDQTVSKPKVENALSLSSDSGEADYSTSLTNGASKLNIEAALDYAQEYTLSLTASELGTNGEKLGTALQIKFNTADDNIIKSLPPCTSVNDCLRSVDLEGSSSLGKFEFYANYPIYEENAEWESLTQAIIVVHGASHNPDAYYSYMTNTLENESLSANTVLIAPYFRPDNGATANDFYWSGTGWRDGKLSNNTNKISSFQVLDDLIDQLADKTHFPVLDQIIVTGQSSGGRFTHVYAPANFSETDHPEISFHYIVGESQYFYYPDGQRIDESNNQLYTPTGCGGYDIWPFGFNIVPDYLTTTDKESFNFHFRNREINYLLGNGSGNDGSLNTSDCSATLLGSSRFARGENIFRYMELVYPGEHKHTKTIANGILHDGSAIYQSPEFKQLLMEILE
jgi:hypothetical protein